MKIKVTLEKEYTEVDNKSITLPNSVNIVGQDIIITDSGNNRVCVFDKDIKDKDLVSIGGKFGITKYTFKEPVYSTKIDEYLAVCDWHNNRLVIYKDSQYYHQVGLLGKIGAGKINNIFRFMKSLKSNGSFTKAHFINTYNNKLHHVKYTSYIINLLQGIKYYITNPSILIHNVMNNILIAKPNGVVFVGENIYFTQKNNYAITKFNIITKKIVNQISNNVDDIEFGRLGQLTEYNKNIYACDETNNIIWIFDYDLKLVKKISITSYNIFSIAINKNFIATCGGISYSIFDHNYNLLYEMNGNGEYHGIALDGNEFYISNRLFNKIERYKINLKEKT